MPKAAHSRTALSTAWSCAAARAASRTHYVYILLLTTNAQSEDVVMGIQAGTDDYVTKPFDPDELCARLWAGRRILDLQDQLRPARDALHEQAMRDGLTGAWNRATILEILDKELASARREAGCVGVVWPISTAFSRSMTVWGA